MKIYVVFIGTVKSCFYIGTLIGVYWVLNGFNTLEQIDIVGVLAVGAILKHFIDTEQLKSFIEELKKK